MRKIAKEIAFLLKDDTEISWQMVDILNLMAEKLDSIEDRFCQPAEPEKCLHLTIHYGGYDIEAGYTEDSARVGKCRDCGATFDSTSSKNLFKEPK